MNDLCEQDIIKSKKVFRTIVENFLLFTSSINHFVFEAKNISSKQKNCLYTSLSTNVLSIIAGELIEA